MKEEKLKTAIEAEGNEQIECPFCGDVIPAFELKSDHAHPEEQSKLILDLLNKNDDEG